MNTIDIIHTKGLNNIDSWLELIQVFIKNLDRKPTTKDTYFKSLRSWILFLREEPKAPDINLALQYKNYLIQKNLSAYTISAYLSAVKTFFDYLVERHLIPYNPAKSIRGIKKPKSRRDALTKEEALRLLSLLTDDTLESLRNKAILLLKLFTGLRDVSLVNLNIEDLQVKENRHILYYKNKGKDVSEDLVVLDDRVYEAINKYLIRRNNFIKESPLFSSLSDRNKNARLETQSIRLIIRGFFKKAQIIRPEIQPHSLRHSAITFAVLEGSSLTQAKEMAGHANIETTNSYFHNINRLKDPAEFYVARFLFDKKDDTNG